MIQTHEALDKILKLFLTNKGGSFDAQEIQSKIFPDQSPEQIEEWMNHIKAHAGSIVRNASSKYTNEIGYLSKTQDFLTAGGFTAIFELKESKRQKEEELYKLDTGAMRATISGSKWNKWSIVIIALLTLFNIWESQ